MPDIGGHLHRLSRHLGRVGVTKALPFASQGNNFALAICCADFPACVACRPFPFLLSAPASAMANTVDEGAFTDILKKLAPEDAWLSCK